MNADTRQQLKREKKGRKLSQIRRVKKESILNACHTPNLAEQKCDQILNNELSIDYLFFFFSISKEPQMILNCINHQSNSWLFISIRFSLIYWFDKRRNHMVDCWRGFSIYSIPIYNAFPTLFEEMKMEDKEH